MKFDQFPQFEFEWFKLRQIEPTTDAQYYLEYMSNSSVAKYLTNDNVPKSYVDSFNDLNYWRKLFMAKNSVYWGIALSENDQLIGSAGFNWWRETHAKAELSYDLDCDYWGNGVMYCSLCKIIEFGFNKMYLNRIQATVLTWNDRSIRLLEKLKFKKEGVLKDYEIINNKYEDYFMYSILRSDFEAVVAEKFAR